jgi:hypothetical protein
VSGLFAYAAQFQKDEARDNHGRFSSGGGGMLAETAAKVKRIAQLQAERLAAGRGERVYGSPASSFEAIARAMLKKAKRGGGGLLGRRDRKPLAYPGVGQLSGERAGRAHALSLSRYASQRLSDLAGSSSHLSGHAVIAAPRSNRRQGQ